MPSANTIMENIFKTGKNKIREPGGAVPFFGLPVIRFQKGRYHLAVFAFCVKDRKDGSTFVSRPSYYLLGDLETGAVKLHRCTGTDDFTREPFRSDRRYRWGTEWIEERLNPADYFERLDRIIEVIVQTGSAETCRLQYEECLDDVLKGTPKDFRVFVSDLSNIEPKNKFLFPARVKKDYEDKTSTGRGKPSGEGAAGKPGTGGTELDGREAAPAAAKGPGPAPVKEENGGKPVQDGDASGEASGFPRENSRAGDAARQDAGKEEEKQKAVSGGAEPSVPGRAEQPIPGAGDAPEPKEEENEKVQNDQDGDAVSHDPVAEESQGEVEAAPAPDTAAEPCHPPLQRAEAAAVGEALPRPETADGKEASVPAEPDTLEPAEPAEEAGVRTEEGNGSAGSPGPAETEPSARKAEEERDLLITLLRKAEEEKKAYEAQWQEAEAARKSLEEEKQRMEAALPATDLAETAPVTHRRATGHERREKEARSVMKEEEKGKTYRYTDIRWKPAHDLSDIPDRYYHIAKRLAPHITFLPCSEPRLRYEYPVVCFRKDVIPGSDPWLLMQLKVLNSDVPAGHFRTTPGDSILSSCRHREECMFPTCPYMIAAYIRYLQETAPDEIVRQRERYRAKKNVVDTEGQPGYAIRVPSAFLSTEELARYRKYIDMGLFSIVAKPDSPDIYVITAVTDGRSRPVLFADGEEPEIQAMTVFCVTRDELECGVAEHGEMRSIDGKRVPQTFVKLAAVDYLVRTGAYAKYRQTAEGIGKTGGESLIFMGEDGELKSKPAKA